MPPLPDKERQRVLTKTVKLCDKVRDRAESAGEKAIGAFDVKRMEKSGKSYLSKFAKAVLSPAMKRIADEALKTGKQSGKIIARASQNDTD